MNARAIGVVALLALSASPCAAQDSFGRRPVTGPPDTSRAPAAPATPAARGARATSAASAPTTDRDALAEREDFGIAPTRTLHNGPMHGPTPSSIPGGQVITTAGVRDLQRRGIPHVLVDVLGAPDMLPNAIPGAWMSQPGSFNDGVQTQSAAMLAQATRGRKDTPVVFYCLSPHCWMSYNAALRAINAGYTNVLWYRGGVEAWKRTAPR